MIDEEFRHFVASNIQSMDQLHRIFAELSLNICEEFWDQLGTALKVDIPAGYSYISYGKNFSPEERVVGWRKNIAKNIAEDIDVLDQRDVHIVFGCAVQPEELALGEWLLYRPWTGVRVWLDKGRDREKKLLDEIRAKRETVKTELPDRNNRHMSWLYEPLDIKTKTSVDFYFALDDRCAQITLSNN